MSKPSWDDSPTWANYLAQDYDGSWTWYENKPSLNPILDYWFRTEPSKRQLVIPPKIEIWKETLEERPKEINNEDN